MNFYFCFIFGRVLNLKFENIYLQNKSLLVRVIKPGNVKKRLFSYKMRFFIIRNIVVVVVAG